MNPLNLEGGLENLEVVYFPGTNFFEILGGGGLSFRGAVSPRGDLVLFGASVIT